MQGQLWSNCWTFWLLTTYSEVVASTVTVGWIHCVGERDRERLTILSAVKQPSASFPDSRLTVLSLWLSAVWADYYNTPQSSHPVLELSLDYSLPVTWTKWRLGIMIEFTWLTKCATFWHDCGGDKVLSMAMKSITIEFVQRTSKSFSSSLKTQHSFKTLHSNKSNLTDASSVICTVIASFFCSSNLTAVMWLKKRKAQTKKHSKVDLAKALAVNSYKKQATFIFVFSGIAFW